MKRLQPTVLQIRGNHHPEQIYPLQNATVESEWISCRLSIPRICETIAEILPVRPHDPRTRDMVRSMVLPALPFLCFVFRGC